MKRGADFSAPHLTDRSVRPAIHLLAGRCYRIGAVLGHADKPGAISGRSHAALAEMRDVLLEIYAASGAMNQLLLAHLDPRAWRAAPPGQKGGGRTIGAIFAHLHNVRLSWLRHSAPHLKCPARLDPHRCTMKQAVAAHKRSAKQCLRMLGDALSAGPRRRVKRFTRDAYVQSWPAGASMFAYMFAHEAHHRGQIIMLARQSGFRLPVPAAYGIWHWEKLWKKAGLKTRPR
jgi:uncharacterized damage-inducible protein DinB